MGAFLSNLIQRYESIRKEKSRNTKVLSHLLKSLTRVSLVERKGYNRVVMVYEYAIKICKDLVQLEPENPEHYLHLGILYRIRALISEINGFPYKSVEWYKCCLEPFKKAISLGDKNYASHRLLKLSHKKIKAYEKLIKKDKKMKYRKRKKKLNSFHLTWAGESGVMSVELADKEPEGASYIMRDNHLYIFKNNSMLLIKHIRNRNTEVANLVSKIKENPNYDPLVYFVKGFVYSYINDNEAAINAFEKCIKEAEPFQIPLACFQLGLLFVEGREFILGSHAFYKAQKNYQHPELANLSRLLHTFCLGMGSWQAGMLDKAYRHFCACSTLIKKYNIRIFKDIIFLKKILRIDNRIIKLSDSSDFKDLHNRAYKTLMTLLNLLVETSNKGCLSSYLKDVIWWKRIFLDTIIQTFDPDWRRHREKQYRKEIVNAKYMGKESQEKELEDLEKGIIGLSYFEELLLKWNLEKEAKATSLLKYFILEVKKYPSPWDVPLEKQDELIRSLGPCFRATSSKISTEFVSKAMLKSTLKSMLNPLEKNIQKIAKNQLLLEALKDEKKEKKVPPKKSKTETQLVEINFYEDKILINSEPTNTKSQALCLFEHLGWKGKGHWIWSFVVFEKWWKNREIVPNPRERWGKVETDIDRDYPILRVKRKKKCPKDWIGVTINHLSDEYTYLEGFKAPIYKSNIIDAKKLCQQATLEPNNALKLIDKAKKVYPNCVEICILWTKLHVKDIFQNIESEELNCTKEFFLRMKDNYESALQSIKNWNRDPSAKDKKYFQKPSSQLELKKIEAQKEDIVKCISILQEYGVKGKDILKKEPKKEIKYEKLSIIINAIKKKDIKEIEKLDLFLQTCPGGEEILNELMEPLLPIAIKYLARKKNTLLGEDPRVIALECFFNAAKRIDFAKYNTFAKLKGAIVREIEEKELRIKLTDKERETVHRYSRKIVQVTNELAQQNGQMPSEDKVERELIEKHRWPKGRYRDVKRYEERERRAFSIKEETDRKIEEE